MEVCGHFSRGPKNPSFHIISYHAVFLLKYLSILTAVVHIDISTLKDRNVGTLRNTSINIDMGSISNKLTCWAP